MSRSSARNKNKRQWTDDGDSSSSVILRKIYATGQVSQNDICQLYLIWKPLCQGCHGNSKDSPNCFCGLIPSPGRTRKSGLWQRIPDIIQSLGPNPYKDLRTSIEVPAGLTNLGATCYANSILQCLFMNSAFREGIFSVESDLLKQHPVLDQLARLFAQLHSSRMGCIDSAPFIKSLELDNGVQQDSHEFLTLFLSLLERSLSHSMFPNSRAIVQDLFRGNVSHVTKCSICGKDSDASSKMEDFYELELNIKGLDNLDESLRDYLSLEELHGENQYFCESCGRRVDATRCINLRSLPSVLNLQLKRYIFLPKTTTKKKITSAFGFPRILNMGKHLCSPTETSLVYELSAILIHKGTAVNSGHYVAHIKDEKSGHWWEFDDEHVSKLGLHPFGESSSSLSMKTEQVVQSNWPETVNSVANGDHKVVNNNQGDIYSSSDAYMLMYSCASLKENLAKPNKTEVVKCNVGASNISLPHHLHKEMQELNLLYSKDCEEYQSRKDKHLSYITERREEVKQVLSEAPVQSFDEPYFWISTDWLRQWADIVNSPAIDNSSIQCLHGKIPFSHVTSMKRISSRAWQRLFTKYGGGPALASDDFCITCLKNAAEDAVNADDYKEKRALLRNFAEAALAGQCPDGNAYYVSRTWLLQWLRRKSAETLCDADAGPTAALTCAHGKLILEQASGAKRVLVPEVLWNFFYECASKVKPGEKLASVAFPSDTEACEICSREMTEVANFEDSLRAEKNRKRQNHEKLIIGKSLALHTGCRYFLVPSTWLAKWKAYVTTTGKNISSAVQPDNLEVVVSSLICQKHLRLVERPLELVCKHGVISQKTSSADGLMLISESDWKFFCEEWNGQENKGIHAEIVFNDITKKVTGSCEELPIVDEKLDHNNEANLEELNPFIRTDPELCEDCIGERESSELMQKLNYCDEDICVYLVHGKEAPRSIIKASGTASVRTSKRSKRTSYGNSINFTVSSTTSIYQLKMMIWEAFGVVKENQKLHKSAVQIEGDSATLADKSIFPGDTLWVMDTEIYENRDIADELSEHKIEPLEAEEGFRGTLLTSEISVQGFQEKQFRDDSVL